MSSIFFAKMDFRKYRILLPFVIFALTLVLYYLFSLLQSAMHPKEDAGKSAFNTELPAPKLDERYKNKLDLYMEARQDSLRQQKEARRDSLMFPADQVAETPTVSLPTVTAEPIRQIRYDANEQRMENALAKLQKVLSRQPEEQVTLPSVGNSGGGLPNSAANDLVDLEKQIAATAGMSTEDPEIDQLDGMLDKILEIKRSGGVSNTGAAPRDTASPLQVTASAVPENVAMEAGNGFYGISETLPRYEADVPPGNGTIKAVVHGEQRVQTGSTVRLRLLQDIYINNARIPANSFVFGTATVSKERVQLDIRHAVHANTVLPVKLSVFDTDGIAGISAPGADARDAGREGISQAVQNMELYSMDPSIGAQAAASGIQAAKSLLSKKTKTPYALLKANHTVMLVNAHN